MRFLIPVIASGALLLPSRADVTLPAIFSDHSVLQQADKVPVWGKAAPGESVTVTLDAAHATTIAQADGTWKLALDLSKENEGPFDMLVQGKNRLTITDVLVGQVWLCSGQSNMQFNLGSATGGKEEVAASENPRLREFHVRTNPLAAPADDCAGKWVLASPATSANFTAVGYFFAKALQREMKFPVGLINSSQGGTPIEAWMSAEAMDHDPTLKQGKDKALGDATGYAEKLAAYAQQYRAWQKQYQREDHPPVAPEAFASPTMTTTTTWKKLTSPGLFSAAGLPDSGAIWLRRSVTIADTAAHKPLEIDLPPMASLVTVYWNGEKIGEATPENGIATGNQRYHLPVDQVQAGTATLAIRFFSPKGGGQISSYAPFRLAADSLQGDWQATVEYALPALSPEGQAAYPQPVPIPMTPDHTATELYNGMIHPIIPYAIKGALWYQGEANTSRAFQYRTALPLLITDWRAKWGEGDFPFYLCQLPNFGNYLKSNSQPAESDWAVMRESQAQALSLPHTAHAVLIDLGEEKTIHPLDKKDVGERLAKIALARTYGQATADSGPIYKSFAVEGGKVRITFDHLEGGLVAHPLPATYQPLSISPATEPVVRHRPDSQLEGFQICGADHHWKWADAQIDGETVLISSPDVPSPVAVRYAWADFPFVNLYNRIGLPAAPFRTDAFPVHGQEVVY